MLVGRCLCIYCIHPTNPSCALITCTLALRENISYGKDTADAGFCKAMA